MIEALLWVLGWFGLGLFSVLWWWTKDNDFTSQDIVPAVFFSALLGPVAFLVGWLVHGDHRAPSKPKTFIKRRRK